MMQLLLLRSGLLIGFLGASLLAIDLLGARYLEAEKAVLAATQRVMHPVQYFRQLLHSSDSWVAMPALFVALALIWYMPWPDDSSTPYDVFPRSVLWHAFLDSQSGIAPILACAVAFWLWSIGLRYYEGDEWPWQAKIGRWLLICLLAFLMIFSLFIWVLIVLQAIALYVAVVLIVAALFVLLMPVKLGAFLRDRFHLKSSVAAAGYVLLLVGFVLQLLATF